ncbi:MAG: RecQ family ATP-dependent DNA helicase [Ignavibacteria bacterium]|nr:RecQ family ATP-dependent DNA helicase [Ignavibacteria bacterium]MBT8381419.1 RecQ family ATP-dependent DNA helicase [Ignavibacteria bacterium]MBT8390152.1 RecQ family ATP-dependent DNA helicase [Ignavibacteria bacterium]NNJ53241.1 RecQ family ATP-dependent DNA helicase [Ignavibacteriaceae bacterium]NNL20331.1 RecQ family ATP-dependent DNA helicase [Ignavibacteriaceae bacterium]
MNPAQNILIDFFNYETFRAGQEEIIDAILNSKFVVAVLPTGAGKSICFQIPALLSDNFSIVVSPLIALMKDQVDSLNKKSERAAFINSTMNFQESESVLNKIALGKVKLLYLAPEKLESIKFADRIKGLNPSYLFVDEAHCISEWGHNFRPSYLKIKEFISHASIKKIAAFTATATPEVVEDIVTQLELKEPKIFVRGFERENLHVNVVISKNKKKKCIELLQKINGPAIIYTSSRKKAEEVAEHLTLNGFACSYYHAGLPSAERRRIQEDFIEGETEIITATNAFGMGIDKKNIRLVIHYNIPGSIENYYQETGRAGRDGENSFCLLLYDEKDLTIQNYFISTSHPNKDLIINIYKAVCDYNRIAVGNLPEKELIVDEEYISNYTGAKINKGILHTTIKYLESSGYLTRISGYEKRDTIQVIISKDKLKLFVNSTSNNELKNVILILLREFSGGIFHSPIKISIPKLSYTIGIAEHELKDVFNVLDNLGIIAYNPSIPKETVMLTTARVADDRLVLNYKFINESYINSKRKLDKMVEYVFTQDCRFKYILNYFGEKLDNYKCRKCDNCTTTNRIPDSTSEYISDSIINTLKEADEAISETALIQILKGEHIKNSLKLFDYFGACKNFSPTEIKIVIQELVSNGKINKNIGSKNYYDIIHTTQRKTNTKKSNEDKLSENNYNSDLYLFNLLREVRKTASERFMQSGYLICPDNVLREVVKNKPKNKYELLSINGFNSRMLNKVGNEFIEVIKNYLKEKQDENTVINKSSLPQNIIHTQKLLKKKYTLKEIAQALKLSEAVVSMQIETIIEYNPVTDVSNLFGEETYNQIMVEVKRGYENLKELKEKLPPKITYPQIRIAAAKHKFSSQLLA